MDWVEGIVMFAQESRFQVIDCNGVGHHFVLSQHSPADPEQLPELQRDQRRVRVDYVAANDVIAHRAVDIFIIES